MKIPSTPLLQASFRYWSEFAKKAVYPIHRLCCWPGRRSGNSPCRERYLCKNQPMSSNAFIYHLFLSKGLRTALQEPHTKGLVMPHGCWAHWLHYSLQQCGVLPTKIREKNEGSRKDLLQNNRVSNCNLEKCCGFFCKSVRLFNWWITGQEALQAT